MSDSVRSVASALDEVRRWQADAEERRKAELNQVGSEIASLERSIDNLKKQIAKLTEYQRGLEAQADRLPNEASGKSYTAVFDVLGEQAASVAERAGQVGAVEAERMRRLEAALSEGEAGELMSTYKKFKSELEPMLANFPEAYRAPLLTAHADVEARLTQHVQAAFPGPVEVEGALLSVDVVYALDALPDEPALLVMVIPVAASSVTDWMSRDDDLQTWVAARLAQGVQMALKGTVSEGAPLAFGGHQGLLALELELPPTVAETLRGRLADTLKVALGTAPELTAARVALSTTEVVIDHVLPPEDEAAADDDDEVTGEEPAAGEEAANA